MASGWSLGPTLWKEWKGRANSWELFSDLVTHAVARGAWVHARTYTHTHINTTHAYIHIHTVSHTLNNSNRKRMGVSSLIHSSVMDICKISGFYFWKGRPWWRNACLSFRRAAPSDAPVVLPRGVWEFGGWVSQRPFRCKNSKCFFSPDKKETRGMFRFIFFSSTIFIS